MTLALVLCVAAFTGCYWVTRRSLVLGILAAAAIGYSYGIVRANVIAWLTHFYFDAALFGFYLGAFGSKQRVWQRAPELLRNWVLILAAWPSLLALLPFQSPLITLVGWRGNLYFLPVILVGTCLSSANMITLARGFGLLNLTACAFAMAEYHLGLERFFPYSAVTELIYRSRDVEGGNFRLVATFANAHAYAATMIATLPVSLGAWAHGTGSAWKKLLFPLSIGAAIAGVLLASTRTNFVVMTVLIGYGLVRNNLGFGARVLLAGIVMAATVSVATNPRMNRFESLRESGAVTGRIRGSVNRSFLEVLVDYPMGNGLGGGGTSIPHFLAGELRRPTAIESEYGRILLEQGIIGLILWMSFIGMSLSKGFLVSGVLWPVTKRVCWLLMLFVFGTAAIGTGLLTAIPATFMWLLLMGWMVGAPMNQRQAALVPGMNASPVESQRSDRGRWQPPRPVRA